MQRIYKCLQQQEFTDGNYKLVPLRDEDKYAIMKWRNEQIGILRQKELLTKEKQELYFSNVVDKLFVLEKPNQLLFSFFENDIFIGYGGLVHIDWESKNGEISFLTATERNSEPSQFANDWQCYLKLLKKIASLHLNFVKIYTYAYDIRPNLFPVLIESDFVEEARLKEHVFINNKWFDVLIHSCFFEPVYYRMANKDDVLLYFKWVNETEVRRNSFNTEAVEYENHYKWFLSKLSLDKCFFYLFFNKQDVPIGQVRIENTGSETVIGVSVDEHFRGKSLSTKMLSMATDDYLTKDLKATISAYIKYDNKASYKSFLAAGFIEQEAVIFESVKSYKLFKTKHD